MATRVLFVDDEPSILNGIGRRLGAHYELVTARSGEEGLAAIDKGPPFPVMVTDMRMPKMNGIQFIHAARAKSPDSVFIMLAGNQDQATAIQALNEGDVFRFLTKPSQSSDLTNAIDAALRQYELVTSEKELLQKTFVGAVSVLTDVLELAQPNIFGRAEAIQKVVELLQDALGLETKWEYKLSARLGMLGFALLPEQERTRFEMALDSGGELHATIRNAAATGRRIIERIPRLDAVARIIGMTADVDGSLLCESPKTDYERIMTGAALLRVAIEWDVLMRQGFPVRTAVKLVRESLPQLPSTVTDALLEQEILEAKEDGMECRAADLVEGMVLQDDVLTSDGVMLLRSGRRLTWTIIEKLRSYESSVVRLRSIKVNRTSELPAVEPLPV